jgi:2-polyprenyl-3-methyl-5-hydroxy-6-metoxy-1,4-benzoquinol methylase
MARVSAGLGEQWSFQYHQFSGMGGQNQPHIVALESANDFPRSKVMRWFELNRDPTCEAVLAHRQQALDRAWRPVHPNNRVEYIQEICRNRVVFDVGCAGHGGEMSRGAWLHPRIQEVAAECLGIDVDRNALKRVRELGFKVAHFDLLRGPEAAEELFGKTRFDVMVAGEVIEHLEEPLKLFQVASVVLKDAGNLIITTPNPYAPHRVFAGSTRWVWENVDHLFYIFPSGIVEMAERTGFRVTEWFTLGWENRWYQLRRALSLWGKALAGAAPVGGPLPRPTWIKYVDPLSAFVLWRRWKWGTLGETAIYTLEKLPAAASPLRPGILPCKL